MIGFIGGGNMARAIIGGLISSGVDCADIIVSDKNPEIVKSLKNDFGVNVADDNCKVTEASQMLFLCVKPNVLEMVALEIKEKLSETAVVVSIVAGKTISFLENLLGTNKKIVRVMPNTPALVGEGMSAVCCNSNAEKEIDEVVSVFNKLGMCEVVTENLMSAVTAVSGSSPAYVFMLIEAMADGAVCCGMTRDVAYRFAAQAVLGSAKMVLETKKHPGELKDMVCSPGGTTIDAVAVLEKEGFRNAIIEAVKACKDKAEKL